MTITELKKYGVNHFSGETYIYKNIRFGIRDIRSLTKEDLLGIIFQLGVLEGLKKANAIIGGKINEEN